MSCKAEGDEEDQEARHRKTVRCVKKIDLVNLNDRAKIVLSHVIESKGLRI